MDRELGDRVVVVGRPRQRRFLAAALTRAGFTARTTRSGEAALLDLDAAPCALLVTELQLPGMDGVDLVRLARERQDDLATLLVVDDSLQGCVNCGPVTAGHDCIRWPALPDELARRARRLIAWRSLRRENSRLRRVLEQGTGVPAVVAVSPVMQAVTTRAWDAAASGCDVLLVGEPGSGRQRVARLIHALSDRAAAPFVAVDLAAPPIARHEARLFGPDREDSPGGLLMTLRCGTVFLDDVADLSARAQERLLEFLVRRDALSAQGRAQPLHGAPRIAAATRRGLQERVARGCFSEALYARLTVRSIHLPPLRERPEDVPELVRQLLRRHATHESAQGPRISAAALEILRRYSWKGNVSELSNVLERALLLSDGGSCDVEHLPADLALRSEPVWRRDPGAAGPPRGAISGRRRRAGSSRRAH